MVKEIQLKKDAQVMLLFNVDVREKLANGSRGVIVDFVQHNDYHKLLDDLIKEKEKIRTQVKILILMLIWVTILMSKGDYLLIV